MKFMNLFSTLCFISTIYGAPDRANSDHLIVDLVTTFVDSNDIVYQKDFEYLHPQNHQYHLHNDTDDIFWQKIGSDFLDHYENPCLSGIYDNEIFHKKIGNILDIYEHLCKNENFSQLENDDDDVENSKKISFLSVENREDDIITFAKNTLVKIKFFKKLLMPTNCDKNFLTSLPFNNESVINSQNITLESLEKLYSSFLYLSAHYRAISQDWDTGKTLISKFIKSPIVDISNEIGTIFEQGMCLLLEPVRDGIPFPNESITKRIYIPATKREVLRYINHFLGRNKRDCIVNQYAEKLLNNIIDIFIIIIKSRNNI